MGKLVKLLSGTLALGGVLMLAAAVSLAAPARAAARPQPSFDNNAWIVSWDEKAGLKEARTISSQLNSVSYFGAALDRRGQVIVLGDARAAAKESLPRYRTKVKRYLSVVNDVYDDAADPQGKTSLKDTEILETLLATQQSRQQHIDELFRTMKEYGYDGLEIDYERVWRNPLVAFRYVKFIQELAAASDQQQILVRIVLEPSAPANRLVFPEGPEYVMMCYNLYGTHTKESGPKADKAFIDTVLSRLDQLPRPHSIAFSTGGCIWEDGKAPRFVTEKEAQSLRKKIDADPVRDEKSGALSVTGTSDGHTVTCWYADAETLNRWKHQALEHGVDGISLWYLGEQKRIADYYPGIVNNQER